MQSYKQTKDNTLSLSHLFLSPLSSVDDFLQTQIFFQIKRSFQNILFNPLEEQQNLSWLFCLFLGRENQFWIERWNGKKKPTLKASVRSQLILWREMTSVYKETFV